ncbi:MAG: LysM peptidoglycan-binding domain-containing protein [Vicinamibacteria bacterium]
MRQVGALLRENSWDRPSKREIERNDPGETPTARLYRVQEDDDLCSIAVQLYGLADFWVFIYNANAEEITKSGGVHPGQILCIPDL